MPPQPLDATIEQISAARRREDGDGQPLPKGVVLGPDGKPCRSCTSTKAWLAMSKAQTAQPKTMTNPPAAAALATQPPRDCPPDVEQLGRSTWSFLHSVAATYPERPTFSQQSDMRQFMGLFGKLYPCWVCADDFRAWMKNGNEPKVNNRDEFGKWLCEAHNAVNVKLGKASFDCNTWEERWRTGWKDGRCE